MSLNVTKYACDQIATAFKLTSIEMARLTGIRVTRIRSVRAGQTQTWQPGECKTLMRVFGVRGAWLITGQGEMLRDSSQDAERQLLQDLQHRANALPPDQPRSDSDVPRFALARIGRLYQLDDAALIERTGFGWRRVKSILAGNIKSWRPGECAALMRLFHVSGDWLCTGEGRMIQSVEDRLLNRRLGFVKTATALAVKAGLDADDASRLSEILMAVDSGEYKRLPALMRPPKK